MTTLLAKLTPPPGQIICQGPLCDRAVDSSGQGVTDLLSLSIQIVFIAAGLVMLLSFFRGAFEYITSGGDKERTNEARQHITHAGIGIIILLASYVLWIVLVSDVLGIFGPGGAIRLPTLGQ